MPSSQFDLNASSAASPLYYPKHATALLFLDYQNLIISMAGPQTADAVATTVSVGKWADSHKIPVVHCMIDVDKSCPPHFKAAARMTMVQNMVKSKPEIAEEQPALAALSGRDSEGHYWFKRTPGVVSATHSPGFVELLKSHGIKSLILCGLSTSGCVLSTARAAADAGFVVTVLEDCCADPVEGLHDSLIKHVLPMQAHVLTSKQLMSAFDEELVKT